MKPGDRVYVHAPGYVFLGSLIQHHAHGRVATLVRLIPFAHAEIDLGTCSWGAPVYVAAGCLRRTSEAAP